MSSVKWCCQCCLLIIYIKCIMVHSMHGTNVTSIIYDVAVGGRSGLISFSRRSWCWVDPHRNGSEMEYCRLWIMITGLQIIQPFSFCSVIVLLSCPWAQGWTRTKKRLCHLTQTSNLAQSIPKKGEIVSEMAQSSLLKMVINVPNQPQNGQPLCPWAEWM